MQFIVLFEDAEGKEGERAKHMAAHLEFLGANAQAIRAAGPLSDEDGAGAGGLWHVEAESADAVWALVHEDPFWPTGLRASVRVLAWRQVFADGRALV